ncbi:MAG: TonB-dependent receptor [Candidatus Marinimicrobia bacterium]|nr:TonB-dependent receptor [Candidatus Neomarinimicrobiota bacterium]MCF7830284.1 TonB-dependent receptor [Candidatus Neomarinimicrobiota bacterium]MCF7882193.1 TonB-dependent receptor [Candidatus Neomarinimicrobiota bacterium]
MGFRYLGRLLSVLLIEVILALPLFAQTGKIVGHVRDADTGQPLPSANVIILGTSMGAATDMEGRYTIVNVAPGEYEVQASVIGYAKLIKQEVIVSVDQITRINFNLNTSNIVGEEVVVVAEREVLNKEVPNTQQVITNRQMTESAGVRTINQYLEKQPGITGANHLEIRGGSAEQTGAMVNGMSFVDVRMGRAESTIPLSAVEQVSLVTGGFNAEYGNFRSGLLNITTKKGSRDAYHGRISYTRNIPRMKRFGKSLYDPTNYGLRPYLDPVVGFQGTGSGWLEVTNGDTAEAEYLKQGHASFAGWNGLVNFYNNQYSPYEDATPMDLYLWAAWMHQTVPNFEKLEELYPEKTLEDPRWEEKKQALRDHAHLPEGDLPDWNFDGGFGGPVPFVGGFLGDMTFYVSNQTINVNYIQPVTRPADWKSTTLLTLRSNVTDNMTLNLNGLYRKIKGMAQITNTALANPSLEARGGYMFENNIGDISGPGETYFWHPTMFHPKDQTTISTGLELNYALSHKTFWEFSVQYAVDDYFMDTERDVREGLNNAKRDQETLINFGPIWLNEIPYGRPFGLNTAGIDTVWNPQDSTQFTVYDGLSSLFGVGRRFSGKTGGYYDRSSAQQFRLKFDMGSQISNYHYIKGGLEYNYIDLNNDMFQYGYLDKAEREFRFRRTPSIAAGYIQDQITLEGMIASIGVRVDYYNSGGDVWPTGAHFSPEAFSTYEARDQELRDRLDAGESVIWSRWNAVNDTLLDGELLEKTKNHLAVSPRIGISFPVTERSKFYFNYGHFRATPPYSEMFLYTMNFRDVGLRSIGNPNLEPPRTIQYELGVAYNLLDQYLLNLSTYYKDVTGESGNITYQNTAGTVNYGGRTNNQYEDITGFELNLTKQVGDFLTGWLNYRYMIQKSGYTGREVLSNDPAWNQNNGLYESEESRPTVRPVVAGNVTLHTPTQWGPSFAGIHPIAGWNISTIGRWEKGPTFTWNPAGIRNVTDNLRWPDQYNFDMKLSKRFDLFGVSTEFYVDILNVFNIKQPWIQNGWAFRNTQDYENYLATLKLPMYDDPRYDTLRENNPGLYEPGSDEPGQMRSADKKYINDPDNKMFLYGNPRQIWWGISMNI